MSEPTIIHGFGPGDEAALHARPGFSALTFNHFPPSWADDAIRVDLGHFAQFDQQLAEVLGCEVRWEDREFFILVDPPADAAERIAGFLRDYPRRGP